VRTRKPGSFAGDGVASRLALSAYDGFFSLYDRYQPLKRGKPHVRLNGAEIAELEPGLVRGVRGGVTFDEWDIDGARLCNANAVDALERGAEVRAPATVTEICAATTAECTASPFAIGKAARLDGARRSS
jgi:glycerol-3-phosphate dehydrogenase